MAAGWRPPGLHDKRFAFVIPHVSTATMSVFLAEFAATIASGRHVVMDLDQAR